MSKAMSDILRRYPERDTHQRVLMQLHPDVLDFTFEKNWSAPLTAPISDAIYTAPIPEHRR